MLGPQANKQSGGKDRTDGHWSTNRIHAPFGEAELINRHGPWRSVEAVELATADWVHFWNTKRLHGACGDIPPAEFEAAYHSAQAAVAAA